VSSSRGREAERARLAAVAEEKARWEQLEREAKECAQWNRVRDYVDAVEAEVKARGLILDDSTKVSVWLVFARQEMNRADPAKPKLDAPTLVCCQITSRRPEPRS
jgi:hypothetical protein